MKTTMRFSVDGPKRLHGIVWRWPPDDRVQ